MAHKKTEKHASIRNHTPPHPPLCTPNCQQEFVGVKVETRDSLFSLILELVNELALRGVKKINKEKSRKL